MSTFPGLEKCPPFLSTEYHHGPRPARPVTERPAKLAVTLSRQTGCGAHAVGEELSHYFEAHGIGHPGPWRLYDRNLVEKTLEDHHLPGHLARFMPEDRVSPVIDAVDELLGTHPPSWLLVKQITETVVALAEHGNVILIGRGANLITRGLGHVVHVRLVAALETRVQRVHQLQGLDKQAALDFIRKEDSGRRRYFKTYFGRDMEDALLYDLVLNTDHLDAGEAARIIGEMALAVQKHRSTQVQVPLAMAAAATMRVEGQRASSA
jgi:hypothetical protein